jgi:hypothetical protein
MHYYVEATMRELNTTVSNLGDLRSDEPSYQLLSSRKTCNDAYLKETRIQSVSFVGYRWERDEEKEAS